MNNSDYKKMVDLVEKVKNGTATKDDKVELAKLKAGSKSSGDKAKGSNASRKGNSRKGGNDPQWYKKYPELMESASKFPFNTIAGTSVLAPMSGGSSATYLPNGMLLHYHRVPGSCTGPDSAYNMQMRTMWLEMHRKYRGLGTYEWADLGIALFAIMNAFSDIARAERIYALSSMYNARNRSYPNTLLTALRFDINDISGDLLADFRYQLNRIITKASILCLPKGFAALETYLAMDSNVFKEGDSERSAWYVYDAPYMVEYNAARQSTGGSNEYKARKYTGTNTSIGRMQTFQDIIDDLNELFDVLLTDTDIARICSDVLACFGDNVVTLAYLPEEYTITPICDDTRKLQLHNTTLVGVVSNAGMKGTISVPSGIQMIMYQYGGSIYFDLSSVGDYSGTYNYYSFPEGLTFAITGTSVPTKTSTQNILDIWKDDVSTDDIVELTRQTVAGFPMHHNIGGTDYAYVHLEGFGLVLVTRFELWSNEPNAQYPSGRRIVSYNSDTRVLYSLAEIADFANLEKFDWHPFVRISANGVLVSFFMDVDNYVSIYSDLLLPVHDAAVLSAFKLDAGIIKE